MALTEAVATTSRASPTKRGRWGLSAITPASKYYWIRLLAQNAAAVASLGFLLLMLLIALLAPTIAPYDPNFVNPADRLDPPSSKYWFGTDDLGRDQFSRVIFGLRASVAVGAMSVVLAMVVGVPLGLLAGYYRLVDPLVSRLADTLLAFPFLVLAVGLAAILGPSLATATISVGVAQVPTVVRVTRSEALRLRGLDFVAAAIADGASDAVVLGRHILPNAVNTLIVQATVIAPVAIIGEAVLSFLGLGVRPPTPSLGVMLSSAQPFFRDGPWMAVFPGVAIVVLTLALNLLGDGTRDAFDPKESRR